METLELLRQSVLSVNKVLKDKVKTMGLAELLRNSHPLYRSDFAMTFYKEGIITRDEVEESTKFY